MELFVSSSSTVRVWDARSGAETWCGQNVVPQSRTLCQYCPGAVVCAANAQAQLQFLSLGKKPDYSGCRSACWEPLRSAAVTVDGIFCAGGSASGKIYIWNIASGELLRLWEAHYSEVSVLKFTDDAQFLISAEAHAYIKVWGLCDAVDLTNSAGSRAAPQPRRVWSSHTLPITDMVLGAGGLCSRIVSSSDDQSVSVWSLASGNRLASVRFPSKCSAIAMDSAERDMFVGCADGNIYAMSLSAAPTEHFVSVGEHCGRDDAFRGHVQTVTALALGVDGSILLSASSDATIRVWDVRCRTAIRLFERHRGTVTDILPLGLHASRGLALHLSLDRCFYSTPSNRAMCCKPFLKTMNRSSNVVAAEVPLKLVDGSPGVLTHRRWGARASHSIGWADDVGIVPNCADVDLRRLDLLVQSEAAVKIRWSTQETGNVGSVERERWKGLAARLFMLSTQRLLQGPVCTPRPYR